MDKDIKTVNDLKMVIPADLYNRIESLDVDDLDTVRAELKRSLEKAAVEKADIEKILSITDTYIKKRKLKYFFTTGLPNHLIDMFQVFLIVEKIFKLEPFGHISWWLVFLPSVLFIFLTVAFMTDEERQKILDDAKKKVRDGK